MKKGNKLRKIKEEVINCKKCPLYKDRIKNRFYPVIGEGSHAAKIMFTGEAPGLNEAKTGRPFCGAAGKVLDELFDSISIERKDVFICNLLKCRPVTPDLKNRAPKLTEIEACSSYLDGQIKTIKPEVICTLGNYSTAYIFEKFGLKDRIQGISKIHGKIFEIKNLFQRIKIIPLYHPAVVTYNPNMKEILKKDFEILEKYIS